VDRSALLRHEILFALGQMRDVSAMPVLIATLADENEHGMVRHEAAEAIGAIGMPEGLEVLKRFAMDTVHREVRETCDMALRRIQWHISQSDVGVNLQPGKFISIDPAPPSDKSLTVPALEALLLDSSAALFDRYGALFALRNRGGADAIAAMCACLLNCDSALLKHEVAYVLGQLQDSSSDRALRLCLSDAREHAMVRHEAAEALGSVAPDGGEVFLKQFLDDEDCIVRESIEVALDMLQYERSGSFVALSAS